jgi:hypothetical protein
MGRFDNIQGTSENFFQIGLPNQSSPYLRFQAIANHGDLIWSPSGGNKQIIIPNANGTLGLAPLLLDYNTPGTVDITTDIRRPGYTMIALMELLGGGGGGGSGRQGAAGTGRSGGGSGAGANILRTFYLLISLLPAGSAILEIASGGNGANARTTPDTNGTNGNTGGTTRLTIGGIVVFEAAGGSGGSGGGTSTGTAGAANAIASGRGNIMGSAGAAGAAGVPSNAPIPTDLAAGGGGGGAGISVGNAASANGGSVPDRRAYSQLTHTSGPPNMGYYGVSPAGLGGYGAGSSATGPGTPAGDGGYGGGGGGGNGTLNGVTGQKGADGGTGRARFILL